LYLRFKPIVGVVNVYTMVPCHKTAAALGELYTACFTNNFTAEKPILYVNGNISKHQANWPQICSWTHVIYS
jgi:hypothetical protein